MTLVERLREMAPVMAAHGNKFPRYPNDNDFADTARLLTEAADLIEHMNESVRAERAS